MIRRGKPSVKQDPMASSFFFIFFMFENIWKEGIGLAFGTSPVGVAAASLASLARATLEDEDEVAACFLRDARTALRASSSCRLCCSISIRLGEVGESSDCIGTADREALGTKGAAVADSGVLSPPGGVPCGAVGFFGKLG